MKGPKKKWLMVVLPILVVVVLLTVLFVGSADTVVDALWYDSLGYLNLFFLKIGYKYMVLLGVVLSFFLFIFLNFWVASRFMGLTLRHKDAHEKGVIRAFRSGSLKIYTPLSLLLAIPLSMPLFREWEKLLLFFNAPAQNISAGFGLDVSFYLFALPIANLLQGRLLFTLLVMLLALTILYATEMKLLSREDQPMFRGAKIHLSILLLLLTLVQIGSYGLEALMLQYSSASLPLFYGPGYAEMVWGLPLLGTAAVLVLITGGLLAFFIQSGKGRKGLIFFAILSLFAHFNRSADYLLDAVNKFDVKPNELSKQSKYISQTIQSTLTGYQLQEVERRPYDQLPMHSSSDRLLSEGIEWDNIPLWDNELLGDVYQELQGIRPYYRFSGVDAARYRINGELHQVYLAARELDMSRLPSSDRWINERLEYTHGYGLVMTPAAQKGEEKMDWLVKDMPPESSLGFEINRPSIYYGLLNPGYVIAPNESGEFHYPGGDDQQPEEKDYEGTGGVLVSGFWRKVLFALHFNDLNLFLTKETNENSRIHFRRNVQERVARLTPFLQLDHNPYLVVTSDRLYWIIDAYTTSRWYPNSQPFEEDLNYIRNSVKVVVDAYDGSVSYYLSDPTDPIARAYQKMYPGVIQPLSDMSEELRAQIRYPRDLFEIQMRMYARYHQTDPEIYYKDEDLMQFAEIVEQDTQIQMKPYYLTLDLIEPDKREFLLLTPLLPAGRDNLRALAVVSSDAENYGRMVLYTFPKGSQIFGPPQINALIDQNTEIAQNITLWNQQGSEVKRGKMIVMPVNGHILYIQPLYMEATGRLRIPQLKRVIVSADERVAMGKSLEEAVRNLEDELMKGDDVEE